MSKLFKTAILGVSALTLPFVFATTVNAEGLSDKDAIETKLEYQTSTDGSSMRFISTIELNGRTLDDITNIELYFDLSKDGEETKRSKTTVQTKVYEKITGDNGKPKADNTYYSVFKITDLTKNYTGWSITPYFKYNYSDHSTETVTASSWIIGVKRQYFVQTDTDWGTDLYYYMYKSETEHNKEWPGEKMHLYDADNNIYYFDYMPSAGYTTVIFNNGDFEGHKQTADMTVSSEYNYYLQDNYVALPHPTAEHGATIQYNDNQHWKHCSICDKNYGYENHNLGGEDIEKEGVPYRKITCSECGYSTEFNKKIVYFTNNKGWNNVHVHMWIDGGAGTKWPGVAAEYVGTNEFGEEIYSINVENYQKIIFNGDGGQTIDILLSDLGNYNSVYATDEKDGEGHYNVGYYLRIS